MMFVTRRTGRSDTTLASQLAHVRQETAALTSALLDGHFTGQRRDDALYALEAAMDDADTLQGLIDQHGPHAFWLDGHPINPASVSAPDASSAGRRLFLPRLATLHA